MKKSKFFAVVCIIILSFTLLFVLGCGGGQNNKVEQSKTIVEQANEVRKQAKKEGLVAIEGLTVSSIDKSITVKFPEHYVLLKQAGEDEQYVGINVKNKLGMTVIFDATGLAKVPFNSDDKVLQRKNEALKKKYNNINNEEAYYQKINNKWFLILNNKNKKITLFTTSSKGTSIMLITQNQSTHFLKDDQREIAENIKIQ